MHRSTNFVYLEMSSSLFWGQKSGEMFGRVVLAKHHQPTAHSWMFFSSWLQLQTGKNNRQMKWKEDVNFNIQLDWQAEVWGVCQSPAARLLENCYHYVWEA